MEKLDETNENLRALGISSPIYQCSGFIEKPGVTAGQIAL
jgi:hypothetical protein